MEGSAIIFILIGVIVVWALFFRQINPSSKTDDQLWTLYRMARPGTKELDLIQEEMEHRGLLGDSSKSNLNQENIKAAAAAINDFEKSGMQAELQKMYASGLPEKMFNKVIEIAQSKGIPESEASTLFNNAFEEASLRFQKIGLSQKEADEKAANEVLSKNF